VFPKIFLLHKVVRDAKKVEKHWTNEPMHLAQAQSVRVKEKISFGFVGHNCRDITRS